MSGSGGLVYGYMIAAESQQPGWSPDRGLSPGGHHTVDSHPSDFSENSKCIADLAIWAIHSSSTSVCCLLLAAGPSALWGAG